MTHEVLDLNKENCQKEIFTYSENYSEICVLICQKTFWICCPEIGYTAFLKPNKAMHYQQKNCKNSSFITDSRDWPSSNGDFSLFSLKRIMGDITSSIAFVHSTMETFSTYWWANNQYVKLTNYMVYASSWCNFAASGNFLTKNSWAIGNLLDMPLSNAMHSLFVSFAFNCRSFEYHWDE